MPLPVSFPRMSWLSMLFVLSGLALLISGCAALGPIVGGAATRLPLGPSAATSTPANPSLTLEEAASNRLLVVGADGNIFSVDPDGGRRFNLTTDAGPSQLYNQPTWSSDGNRIAYTQIEGRRNSRLVTVAANGTDRRAVGVPFAPFFYFWNAESNQLAYLSN